MGLLLLLCGCFRALPFGVRAELDGNDGTGPVEDLVLGAVRHGVVGRTHDNLLLHQKLSGPAL
ncbi:hypothetical protein S7W_05952 [Mycobacteroides abscessus M94]|nr:hypothetical protein S7W_05952 [Mycobacteroides abscessus M94]